MFLFTVVDYEMLHLSAEECALDTALEVTLLLKVSCLHVTSLCGVAKNSEFE